MHIYSFEWLWINAFYCTIILKDDQHPKIKIYFWGHRLHCCLRSTAFLLGQPPVIASAPD